MKCVDVCNANFISQSLTRQVVDVFVIGWEYRGCSILSDRRVLNWSVVGLDLLGLGVLACCVGLLVLWLSMEGINEPPILGRGFISSSSVTIFADLLE